jgi:DNA polymerase-4
MALSRTATILHADLDAFYASVEQLLDPSLRGTPVAVGSGVVLAASYEAKAFGIGAGMPGWRARKLCPALRFVDGHFREYQRLGDQVIDLFRDFTPLVERISIDEAFLDVAGSAHLFGTPADIAEAIRRRVGVEIGLPLSVGVARTKHLAKVASQVAKPDGLVVVQPERELEFLGPLPVELMWGVGPATRARLAATGIRTIGDLAAVPVPMLQGLLGQAVGAKLGSLAANVDPRHVEAPRQASSVGAQSALGRRRMTPSLLRSTLGYLADRVAGRLRVAGRAGRTITVRVRFTGMRSVTRATTLALPVSATLTLTELATELALTALADHPGELEITLLAVSVSKLVDQQALQLELPLGLADDRQRPGSAVGADRLSLDHSVDAIRARFGRESVGYASTALSGEGRVPEAFRELAEHHDGRPMRSAS